MHRQIQRVELICSVLICNLLGFVQISVGQNDSEGSFCSLSPLRLYGEGSAVEDNFQGENDERFSQQNGPSKHQYNECKLTTLNFSAILP